MRGLLTLIVAYIAFVGASQVIVFKLGDEKHSASFDTNANAGDLVDHLFEHQQYIDELDNRGIRGKAEVAILHGTDSVPFSAKLAAYCTSVFTIIKAQPEKACHKPSCSVDVSQTLNQIVFSSGILDLDRNADVIADLNPVVIDFLNGTTTFLDGPIVVRSRSKLRGLQVRVAGTFNGTVDVDEVTFTLSILVTPPNPRNGIEYPVASAQLTPLTVSTTFGANRAGDKGRRAITDFINTEFNVESGAAILFSVTSSLTVEELAKKFSVLTFMGTVEQVIDKHMC